MKRLHPALTVADLDEAETTGCCARSTRRWIADPDGVAREACLTHGDAAEHGCGTPAGGCCA